MMARKKGAKPTQPTRPSKPEPCQDDVNKVFGILLTEGHMGSTQLVKELSKVCESHGMENTISHAIIL